MCWAVVQPVIQSKERKVTLIGPTSQRIPGSGEQGIDNQSKLEETEDTVLCPHNPNKLRWGEQSQLGVGTCIKREVKESESLTNEQCATINNYRWTSWRPLITGRGKQGSN
jgi:hypothetical protein